MIGQPSATTQGIPASILRKAWDKAAPLIQADKRAADMSVYQLDPLRFCTEQLGNWFTDDIVRVMQSVIDNPVTLVRSCTDSGKSHAAARIALWFFLVYNDAKVYLTAAPPVENLKRILWGELMGVVNRKSYLFGQFKRRSNSLDRHDESFITCVTIPQSGPPTERESKFSGKHAPHIMFIVDEGDAVPQEVYKGIEGCLSGGDLARLLILFNPRSDGTILSYMEERGLANVVEISAFNHPNVRSGKNIIRGAVSQEVTVRRINSWTEPLRPGEQPNSECFEVPDFLVGCVAPALDGKLYQPLEPGWRHIKDQDFWYTVLGKYPAQSESQLISSEWITAARNRYDLYAAAYGHNPPTGITPTIGVDVAELGGDANVVCTRYGGFVSTMQFWKGVDLEITVDKTLPLCENTKAEMCFFDGTGTGSPAAPMLARRARANGNMSLRAVGVKMGSKPSPIIKSEKGEFTMIRDQLWWALREWLRTDETSMLPPDPMLVEELKAPKYRVTDNGKITITGKKELRDLLKRSPDRADALCLTFTPIAKAKVMRLQR